MSIFDRVSSSIREGIHDLIKGIEELGTRGEAATLTTSSPPAPAEANDIFIPNATECMDPANGCDQFLGTSVEGDTTYLSPAAVPKEADTAINL